MFIRLSFVPCQSCVVRPSSGMVWAPLEDLDAAKGVLAVEPGTHRLPRFRDNDRNSVNLPKVGTLWNACPARHRLPLTLADPGLNASAVVLLAPGGPGLARGAPQGR
jgi:hypothetical protein